MGKANFSGLDFSGERSRFGVEVGTVTSANLDATLASVDAFLTDLAAFSYIPFGNTVTARDVASVGQATNEVGQRETKARIRYRDTVTGATYAVEVPGPILAGRLVAGSDFFNLAQAQVAAFVAEFELLARAPLAPANAVEVINIQVVGRSL